VLTVTGKMSQPSADIYAAVHLQLHNSTINLDLLNSKWAKQCCDYM